MPKVKSLVSVVDSFGHDSLMISKYFILCYDKLCNTYSINQDTHVEKLIKRIKEKFKLGQESIIHANYEQKKDQVSKIEYNSSSFVIELKPEVWLKIDNPRLTVFYSQSHDISEFQALLSIIHDCKHSEITKDEFFMVSYSPMMNDYSLESFKVRETDIDVSSHYNDDFLPVHVTIEKFLKQDKTNGIVLLHGKVGTGKTTYLRWLINQLNKKIIFIPPHMISFISSPEFIPFISCHKDSIILLEDCEELLKPRENTHIPNNGLSNLLNIGDGLLADAFNFKIICTFNADLKDIDRAVLRKGRLIAKYEFGALALDKTINLLKKMGYAGKPKEEMTLAEIFNVHTSNFAELPSNTPNIGFHTVQKG